MEAKNKKSPRGVIAFGQTVEGLLRGKGSFSIAGQFHGTLHLEGDLEIKRHAVVKGDIVAGTVTVCGTVESGTLRAQRVCVKKTGLVKSAIRTESFLLEEGAQVSGSVQWLRGNSSVAVGRVQENVFPNPLPQKTASRRPVMRRSDR